jgi:hypothetical protein
MRADMGPNLGWPGAGRRTVGGGATAVTRGWAGLAVLVAEVSNSRRAIMVARVV